MEPKISIFNQLKRKAEKTGELKIVETFPPPSARPHTLRPILNGQVIHDAVRIEGRGTCRLPRCTVASIQLQIQQASSLTLPSVRYPAGVWSAKRS